MPFAPFVPLRVLSSYSMLEGAIDPKDIAKLAKERGFPAIAICDRNGLYGIMAFAAACKGEGVQPIIGALLGVARQGSGGMTGRRSTTCRCSRRTTRATTTCAISSRRPISTVRWSAIRTSPCPISKAAPMASSP